VPHRRPSIRPALALVALLATGAPAAARASVADTFGLGSRSAALGGATVGGGSDGYAAWQNPAGLPEGPSRLRLSYGLFYAKADFTDIRGIVLRNDTFTSDRLDRGDVREDYRANFGQSLGLALELLPEAGHLTAGLTAYLPLNQVAYLDTGETFVPEYFMYRARTQRPTFDFALGAEPHTRLSVGLGMRVGFGVTGNANLFLQTDTSGAGTAGSSSTARLITSAKPTAAPFAGLLYRSRDPRDPSGASAKPLDHTLGLVVRLPVSNEVRIATSTAAAVFGGAPGININFNASSMAYYDPWSFELGGTLRATSWLTTYAQLDYQLWGRYREPALRIGDSECTSVGCGVEIVPTRNPSVSFRHAPTARLGFEADVSDRWSVRLGGHYRPSIRRGLPVGAGNLLDPPRGTLALGTGHRVRGFLDFDTPYRIDAHVSASVLGRQAITKTANDENGDPGEKVGSPGYTAGGIILGGGVSLSLAF
jgi:hypothetical protein